ncbi:predicted protein [Coccidioides posadasii C735 delta SOWgp]|uniref:BTB domain-containing protein n=1 Tax=Coccidioides posadasii (strain C735) TaxID=222929 RepID=C5PEH6_COCP7|nr:predicted protein [Coccidioides posadasii C735 delta SOWgp]EER23134.1 predicted protein [Coccidioides posadasii C735 delta SOWgp]|eukprot:XP_003065279.1 predicted protein [Coccidioides posadasii C735 delta SOWgp]
MATKGHISLAYPGDLTVSVTQYGGEKVNGAIEIDGPRMAGAILEQTVLFRVEKLKLIENSDYFQNMSNGAWAESHGDSISLKEDNIKSMELWFRLFHSTLSQVPDHEVSIAQVWHMIVAGDNYLPQKIIQIEFTNDETPEQLNEAKGRLRNILRRELFSHMNHIIEEARCDCKEGTVFRYLRELTRICVWPLEDNLYRNSIVTILDRLENFRNASMEPESRPRVSNAHAVDTKSNSAQSQTPKKRTDLNRRCLCVRDWKVAVMQARRKTSGYFEGLCIDGMNATKNLRWGDDSDYWGDNHDEGTVKIMIYNLNLHFVICMQSGVGDFFRLGADGGSGYEEPHAQDLVERISFATTPHVKIQSGKSSCLEDVANKYGMNITTKHKLKRIFIRMVIVTFVQGGFLWANTTVHTCAKHWDGDDAPFSPKRVSTPNLSLELLNIPQFILAILMHGML